jgi:ribosomal protein S27E
MLANLPAEVTKVDLRKTPTHDGRARQMFLRVNCLQKRGAYLIRFGLDERSGFYNAKASHPLPEVARPAGSPGFRMPAVDSSQLLGIAPCPYCSNDSAASCGDCGALFCLSGSNPPSQITCPACERVMTRSADGSGSLKIQQSAG